MCTSGPSRALGFEPARRRRSRPAAARSRDLPLRPRLSPATSSRRWFRAGRAASPRSFRVSFASQFRLFSALAGLTGDLEESDVSLSASPSREGSRGDYPAGLDSSPLRARAGARGGPLDAPAPVGAPAHDPFDALAASSGAGTSSGAGAPRSAGARGPGRGSGSAGGDGGWSGVGDLIDMGGGEEGGSSGDAQGVSASSKGGDLVRLSSLPPGLPLPPERDGLEGLASRSSAGGKSVGAPSSEARRRAHRHHRRQRGSQAPRAREGEGGAAGGEAAGDGAHGSLWSTEGLLGRGGAVLASAAHFFSGVGAGGGLASVYGNTHGAFAAEPWDDEADGAPPGGAAAAPGGTAGMVRTRVDRGALLASRSRGASAGDLRAGAGGAAAVGDDGPAPPPRAAAPGSASASAAGAGAGVGVTRAGNSIGSISDTSVAVGPISPARPPPTPADDSPRAWSRLEGGAGRSGGGLGSRPGSRPSSGEGGGEERRGPPPLSSEGSGFGDFVSTTAGADRNGGKSYGDDGGNGASGGAGAARAAREDGWELWGDVGTAEGASGGAVPSASPLRAGLAATRSATGVAAAPAGGEAAPSGRPASGGSAEPSSGVRRLTERIAGVSIGGVSLQSLRNKANGGGRARGDGGSGDGVRARGDRGSGDGAAASSSSPPSPSSEHPHGLFDAWGAMPFLPGLVSTIVGEPPAGWSSSASSDSPRTPATGRGAGREGVEGDGAATKAAAASSRTGSASGAASAPPSSASGAASAAPPPSSSSPSPLRPLKSTPEFAVPQPLKAQPFRAPPELSEPSRLLDASTVAGLAAAMPLRHRASPWRLVYATWRDGISLATMLRHAAGKAPTLLAVRDGARGVFGAFCSEAWRASPRYYGTGETFVFTTSPPGPPRRWPWWVERQAVERNDFFMWSATDTIAVGGAGGYAISLDEELEKGVSRVSRTFGNEPLSAQGEEFTVGAVELWWIS